MENTDQLQQLVQSIKQQYPEIDLSVWENSYSIELSTIKVPRLLQGQGIGTAAIKAIKDYAQQVGKPIVLRPQPDRGKKAALSRFYKRQGFIDNRGRNIDFTLSSPCAPTMYWKPK